MYENKIKEHMPVVCSNNGQFGTVDHMEGSNYIKLTKDQQGQHHWIPTSWVTTVDDKVHVDRPDACRAAPIVPHAHEGYRR